MFDREERTNQRDTEARKTREEEWIGEEFREAASGGGGVVVMAWTAPFPG